MTDILSPLRNMHRPRLLLDASQFAKREYRRESCLRRLFGTQPIPGSCEAFLRLLSLEQNCDDERRDGSASYSPARHVEILAALLAEAAEISRARLPQAKASATSSLRLVV